MARRLINWFCINTHDCSSAADATSCRPETWLLLSSRPVDLGRLWRGGWSDIVTANIVYSPVEALKTSAPNQRIATTEVELREMIAACDASRTLIIEDGNHHLDHPHLHQSARHGGHQVNCCLKAHV